MSWDHPLSLQATFHTWPLFYLHKLNFKHMNVKITWQWKSNRVFVHHVTNFAVVCHIELHTQIVSIGFTSTRRKTSLSKCQWVCKLLLHTWKLLKNMTNKILLLLITETFFLYCEVYGIKTKKKDCGPQNWHKTFIEA